jgi:manganese/iron transport system ATP-binding protein
VVENLTVHLGQRVVLEDVDLSVRAGEFVGLLGPNGAGKTTLLRAMLGLLPVHSGVVRLDGRPVAAARRLVGYVPQRHEFAWGFPISVSAAVLTGRTSLMGWFRRPGRQDREAVDRALELAGLTELARRPIGELSGGQRQRVLVARALASEPAILLLDEPFSGVDVPTQELLTELFSSLAKSGRALLMTTHDLASAVRSCDRLCLVNRTVIADGRPGDLRDPALLLRAFGVADSADLIASWETNR